MAGQFQVRLVPKIGAVKVDSMVVIMELAEKYGAVIGGGPTEIVLSAVSLDKLTVSANAILQYGKVCGVGKFEVKEVEHDATKPPFVGAP